MFETLTNVTIGEPWPLVAAWTVVMGTVLFPPFYVFSAFRQLHKKTSADHIRDEIRIPGPAPTRKETIEIQRVKKREGLKRHTKQMLREVLKITVLGIGLPLAMLVLITTKSHWFFLGLPVLVDAGDGTPVARPDGVQLFLFFVDQFLKGSLNDLVEVFNINIASFLGVKAVMITNNPAIVSFSLSVFIFRMIVGVYAFALLLYALRTLWLRNYVGLKVSMSARLGQLQRALF
ncbi:MAG: hypothetical protein CMI60_14395 [Parvibaculum sp.]|nr:hypothetical protein [Parvibaculum sp.]|tara:strand:+ start:358 stop:1056 length:699 start_codon:yes stop_codon:yes gene_type:complete